MTPEVLDLRPAPDHVDVLIVGAGISGIGAAWHLQDEQPGRSYAILEARDAIGGTWDLFRYPGIRSDSDLHTFGYAFKPWTQEQAIADGAADPRLHPRDRRGERHRPPHPLRPQGGPRRVVQRPRAVDRRGRARRHRRDLRDDGRLALQRQRLLPLRRGLHAGVPGPGSVPGPGRPPAALARGPRLRRQARRGHRQRRDRGDARPGDGRRGRARDDAAALAELRPAAARRRTPLANWLRAKLGEERAYAITRRKNILRQAAVYRLSRRFPRAVRRLIRKVNEQQLRGSDCDVDVHFKPAYDPWDQRLCAVPDGDLFRALRQGRASVVTDTHRDLHRDRHPAGVRPGARRRRRRHGDRPEPARVRRHAARRRRRARSRCPTRSPTRR